MLPRTLLVLAIALLPACQERHLYTVGFCVRAGTAEAPPASETHPTPEDPTP